MGVADFGEQVTQYTLLRVQKVVAPYGQGVTFEVPENNGVTDLVRAARGVVVVVILRKVEKQELFLVLPVEIVTLANLDAGTRLGVLDDELGAAAAVTGDPALHQFEAVGHPLQGVDAHEQVEEGLDLSDVVGVHLLQRTVVSDRADHLYLSWLDVASHVVREVAVVARGVVNGARVELSAELRHDAILKKCRMGLAANNHFIGSKTHAAYTVLSRCFVDNLSTKYINYILLLYLCQVYLCLLKLVELVEKSLHPVIEELKRWQPVIGEHYLDYKLEEQRNSLAYKPEGYTTI